MRLPAANSEFDRDVADVVLHEIGQGLHLVELGWFSKPVSAATCCLMGAEACDPSSARLRYHLPMSFQFANSFFCGRTTGRKDSRRSSGPNDPAGRRHFGLFSDSLYVADRPLPHDCSRLGSA